MYSVVMATMLAAGSTTPAWHNHRACNTCYSSCYSCSSGCSYAYRGHGHRSSYCSGCAFYSGCCSGYSSCYANYCCGGTAVYYSGCSTCCSSYSICCGGVAVPATPRVVPVPPAGEKVNPPSKKITQEEVSSPTTQRSRITVTVPSDARIWVDNVECPLTSSVRSFETPALNSNQQFFYNIRMEVVRNGQPIAQTQRVVITPGQPVQVDFNGGALVAAR